LTKMVVVSVYDDGALQAPSSQTLTDFQQIYISELERAVLIRLHVALPQLLPSHCKTVSQHCEIIYYFTMLGNRLPR
jgi:hypothetical protein